MEGAVRPARVDLGITLKDRAPDDPRVRPTPGGMTSHVVRITSVDEVDGDVAGWLRLAYELGMDRSGKIAASRERIVPDTPPAA